MMDKRAWEIINLNHKVSFPIEDVVFIHANKTVNLTPDREKKKAL